MTEVTRVMTSIRLDPELHSQLRTIAFERRVSLHSLLLEGAQAVVARYEDAGHQPRTRRVIDHRAEMAALD